MSDFISSNQQIILSEDFFLPGISPASFYGRGIFTTIAIYNSQPFLWDKHWRRLAENAEKIRLDLSQFSDQTVKNSLVELISHNKISNGRARLTFFDESSVSIWRKESRNQTGLLINTGFFRENPKHFRLKISAFNINSNSPLKGIKSCNYLENILALEDAKANGFDEAIRLNERGEIVSACLANVFWLTNGNLFTPNLETGCLAGTTREFILENFAVSEMTAHLTELNEADNIFLTSAGIGVLQATEFEGRNLDSELHQLTQILSAQQ